MPNSSRSVPTTELSRHFSEHLARVRFGGETIVVLKNGAPVAELRALPSGECTLGKFLDIWRSLPPDLSFADDLAKVGRLDQPPENPWD